MVSTALTLFVGALIGWATPQPAWAAKIQVNVGTWVKGLLARSI